MPDLECRMAKVEQRLADAEALHREIRSRLEDISSLLQRQKGFVAGMVFVLGALATVISWLLNGRFHWGG